jgi:Rrf2 family protein
MRLSTKMRYASRAMAELGSVPSGEALSVREVAERQHLSAKYLERIFHSLTTVGLLTVIRGKQGGFLLAKPPNRISLKEVFEAVEGSQAVVECVDAPERCPMSDECPTRDTWVEIQQSVNVVLRRTTIQQLVERKLEKASAPNFDYQI